MANRIFPQTNIFALFSLLAETFKDFHANVPYPRCNPPGISIDVQASTKEILYNLDNTYLGIITKKQIQSVVDSDRKGLSKY